MEREDLMTIARRIEAAVLEKQEPAAFSILSDSGNAVRIWWSGAERARAERIAAEDFPGMPLVALYSAPVPTAGVVQRGELVDVLRQIDEIRQLIADDGFACTFQTLGQYRTALLKSLTATAEEAFNAEQAKTGGMPYGTYGGF